MQNLIFKFCCNFYGRKSRNLFDLLDVFEEKYYILIQTLQGVLSILGYKKPQWWKLYGLSFTFSGDRKIIPMQKNSVGSVSLLY